MLARIFSRISKIPVPSTTSVIPCKGLSSPASISLNSVSKPFRYFSTNKDETESFIPPEKLNSDKEFQEAVNKVSLKNEKVDYNKQASLQALSVRLVKATTSEEVLNLYEQELENKNNLSIEDLCLIFYFACYHKTNIIGDKRFPQLVDSIFENIDQVKPMYLFTLIHSLGIFCFDYGFTLSPTNQAKLGDLILNNLDKFELNQASAISWSAGQIISAPENTELQRVVVSELAGLLLKNTVALTGLDFANILSTFAQCRMDNPAVLEKLEQALKSNLEVIENEDLGTVTRLVVAIGENNLKDKTILQDIFENVIKREIQNLSVDDAATLISVYSQQMPDKTKYFKELIKNVHANNQQLTITSYMAVWLAISNHRMMATDLEKTLKILKDVPFMNSMWKMTDLEGYELVNIIVVMSTIKMDDQNFLRLIIKELARHLTNLDNSDLVNLSRAFTLYVKQEEDFYLKIHEECCLRNAHLSAQDRKLLKETFTKARQFLPSNSPFVEVKLY